MVTSRLGIPRRKRERGETEVAGSLRGRMRTRRATRRVVTAARAPVPHQTGVNSFFSWFTVPSYLFLRRIKTKAPRARSEMVAGSGTSGMTANSWMRLLLVSATQTFPDGSMATPQG